ncbi:head-tail connector protein [Alteraurantiacibacter aquimixticola]|uniref:Phage gp6-like head-tail connector protein n=1 Tax=Alteraurantiacibacter aquimixticola TaxID=2489173 RepID=A0A4T3F3V7_9SPHN|nr:hypothetical protein [Alteraurantiacibacter aquimixticola]TIX49383.1 hypothetical protein E5222_11025 [Alteraurantiacibacter aquimixticola]
MKRAILVPPALVPGALDELKNWLAISTPQDDISLTALLTSALDMCEAFTRQMPLEAQCEEVLPAVRDWQRLSTTPVQSVTGVEQIATDGARTPLGAGDYALDLAADGTARIRLLAPAVHGRIAVRFAAGIAPSWDTLPEALRHGIIRLAAYNYRQRDLDSVKPVPPAAVAALWSPWRRLRLV